MDKRRSKCKFEYLYRTMNGYYQFKCKRMHGHGVKNPKYYSIHPSVFWRTPVKKDEKS